MTKLTTAIRNGDTAKAIKLINYQDIEPILAIILFTVAHIILSPIIYLFIRLVIGKKEVKLSDLHFSYLDWMETDDDYTPGYRPIHLAAIEGNIEVLEALCSRGVELNYRNKTDQDGTALNYALSAGKTNAALWLLDHGANISPNTLFCLVSVPSNMQLLNRLIMKGANVNATINMRECLYAPGGDLLQWVSNVKSMTVLAKAILSNYDHDYLTVASLLEAGADPNKVIIIDGNPETALSIALRKHRWCMAVKLLRGGAFLCVTWVKTEYSPYRETAVPIFDKDMINAVFTLANANNIELSTEQLGDLADSYRAFQRTSPSNQRLIPIADIAHEFENITAPSFIRRFRMRWNDRIVTQGIGIPNAELLIPDAVEIQAPQTEIIVPYLAQSHNLRLRREITFPC